jgi:methylase of polypeptide subunit release factors
LLETRLDDPRVLKALRAVFAEAGYTAEVVAEPRRLRMFLPAAERIPLGDVDERLCALVQLFALGRPVPCEEVEAALAPVELDQLRRAGLVSRHGDRVLASYRLLPHDGLLLAGDTGRQERDVVTAFTDPSITLARLTPRSPRRAMLDLGTGSGIEALLAAPHCREVTAVDINPRALAFAELNARLNGVENIRLLEGSWLEAVGDARFDLIVANPPYVVSPDDEFTYRDSPGGAGALMAQLCRAMPAHLDQGGVAIMLASWPHASRDDWASAPTAWVRDTGCDALILGQGTVDPLTHATSWNVPPAHFLEPEALRQTVARWVGYYRESGIGAISFGAIVLRRTSQKPTWLHAARALSPPGENAAGQLTQLLDGQELLRSLGDRELLAQPHVWPEGASIRQRLQRRSDRFVARPAMVELDGGLGIQAAIDLDALDVLFECDGQRPLADCIERAAGRSGTAAELTPIALGAVHELLANGLLTVASAAPSDQP